jgi:hypothetical protein
VAEFAKPRPGRVSWVISTVLHAVVILLVVTVSWRAAPHVTFFTLPHPEAVALPALAGGGGPGRARSGGAHPVAHAVVAPAPVAPPAPASAPMVSPVVTSPVPQLGDGRLWAVPRPALPGEVAGALYGTTKVPAADSVVVQRLQAMVDSVNRLIDSAQAAHRAPSWVATVGGKKFGMDSSSLYVAGVKIPTAVLAALAGALPRGNFDQQLRAARTAEMSADLLQAARRAQTVDEFRQYVHDIRARKQAERDADRRARGDTLPPRPDTALVP